MLSVAMQRYAFGPAQSASVMIVGSLPSTTRAQVFALSYVHVVDSSAAQKPLLHVVGDIYLFIYVVDGSEENQFRC